MAYSIKNLTINIPPSTSKMNADTSRLSAFYGTIPQELRSSLMRVQEVLGSQPDKVNRIVFLENFGRDECASLERGAPVFTGLRVDLSDTYQLSEKDKLWLHPSYAHLTSMRPGGQQVEVKLPPFDCSAGIYKVHDVNPILGQSEYTDHSIVGLHANKQIRFHGTVGDAYEQARQGGWREEVLQREAQIAEKMRSGDLVHQQWTNLFQRGQTQISYFSGATPRSKINLVHISPLLGYVSDNGAHDTAPSNMFSHDQIIDVSSLGKQGQKRIFESCRWDTEQLQNPYVMQHPLVGWRGAVQGQHYEMSGGKFSNCGDVVDLFSPGAQIRMTPDSESEYEGASDTVRVRATDDLLQHLLASRDNLGLLHPDVYDGHFLKLHRQALGEAIQGSSFAFAT
jgi:hypothetical protein